MLYRRLGSSPLQVSLIGLGGNTFGRHFHFGNYNDRAATADIIARAGDLGINLIDTADMYSAGDSERYIGQAVAGQRDRWLIASKVGMPAGDGPDEAGLARRHIMRSIEGSLRRLGTDHLDLYYAHRADPLTRIDETLKAFDDLVQQGKVRYVACSNFAAWQIAQANERADRFHFPPFVASQSPYNLLERDIESEIIPCCGVYGMGIVAYWPLAQGVLTGKYRRQQPVQSGTRAFGNPSQALRRQMSERNLRIAEALAGWAEARGHQLSELALAWLAARPAVCSIVTGVTSIEQLVNNVRALDWTLEPEDALQIEELVRSTV
jgi:aryl-alcohol dehydrogenase-like predicted oxidoreductase